MAGKTLREIAGQMYDRLGRRDGREHMALPHGLNLVLEHAGDA
jgi:hypothetical protein